MSGNSRSTKALLLAALLTGAASVAGVNPALASAAPFSQGPVIATDVPFPPVDRADLFTGAIVWAFNRTMPFHNQSSVQTTRVLISDITLSGPGDYAIDIADGTGTIVETLTYEQLKTRSRIWSKLAVGGSISVRVRGRDAAAKLAFKLTRIAFDFNAVAEKSPVGAINGLTDVALYRGELAEEVRRIAPSVAKLEYIKNDAKYTCSAFLVTPRNLVTNAHCIASQPVCDTAVAVFDYQKRADGGIALGRQYRCDTFLGADRTLDAAVFALAERPGDGDPQRRPLAFAKGSAAVGEPLILVQHPGGNPKMVSVEGCAASTAPSGDFRHGCDTEQGSSGAPLVRPDGTLVGLHKIGHGGDPLSGRHNTALDAATLLDWLSAIGALPRPVMEDAMVMSISDDATPPPISTDAPPAAGLTDDDETCDAVNPEDCPERFRVPEALRDAQPLPMPTVDDEDSTQEEGGPPAGDEESVSEPGSKGSGITQ